MLAYVLTRYGGADAMELQDVPRPVAGPGEVLVRVFAAGLNPVDYKQREGAVRVITRPRLPLVAGSELAGIVEAVGPGVTRFATGDRVFARVDKTRLGAFAEHAAVHEDLVALMPRSLSYTEAASLPLAGLTALQALRDELKVKAGTKLFISGGAGGVGTLAIQLAKYFGADVTTTASPRGEELVRRLGADAVVDYTKENLAEAVSGFDAALDLVGGETLDQTFKILKPGSKVVSIAGMPEPQTALKDLAAPAWTTALFWAISLGIRSRAREANVKYRYLFMHPSGEDLKFLSRLVSEEKLKPVVDSSYPLEKIGDAFAALEQGRAKGKIVVTMHTHGSG
ncbi:NADP-dependent oxidoreductase [Arthrobacter sp. NPDC080073]|uniref:NADP-dependent oxidoreductase n=1 Tax=Arthrobacter sp. NPDC080073 TaxID=3155919 RepID=UPI00342CB61A